MPDYITFLNWPTDSYWEDPEWVANKRYEDKRKELMTLEDHFPNATVKQLADRAGVPLSTYRFWRQKYKLPKMKTRRRKK